MATVPASYRLDSAGRYLMRSGKLLLAPPDSDCCCDDDGDDGDPGGGGPADDDCMNECDINTAFPGAILVSGGPLLNDSLGVAYDTPTPEEAAFEWDGVMYYSFCQLDTSETAPPSPSGFAAWLGRSFRWSGDCRIYLLGITSASPCEGLWGMDLQGRRTDTLAGHSFYTRPYNGTYASLFGVWDATDFSGTPLPAQMPQHLTTS